MSKNDEEELEKAERFFRNLIKNQKDGKAYTGSGNVVWLDRNDPSDVEWYEDDDCISDETVKRTMEYYQNVDAGIKPRRSARDGLEEIKRKLVNNTQVTQTIINSEQAQTIAKLSVTKVKETESSKLFKMKKKDSQKRVEEQIKKWEMKND